MKTAFKQSKHVTKSHVTETAALPPAAVTPETGVAAPQPSSAATSPSPSAPLSARITGAIALVKQAMVMVAIANPPLSAAQVRAGTKLRKGGEVHIPALAEMSAQYGVEVPSRPTPDMAANLLVAQLIAPLVTLLVRFLGSLESASFEARSEAWATATTLYQMLRKASVRQPALKAELAPLEEFFAYRHPLVTETAPPTAAQQARAAKRLENAAKKAKRIQDAAAALAAGGAPAAAPATNGEAAPGEAKPAH